MSNNYEIKKNVLERALRSFQALFSCIGVYKKELERIKTDLDQENIQEENIFAAFGDELDSLLKELVLEFKSILTYRNSTPADDGSLVIKPVTEDSTFFEVYYAHVSYSDCGERRHPLRVVCKYDNVSYQKQIVEDEYIGYTFYVGTREFFIPNFDYFKNSLEIPGYNAQDVITELNKISKTICDICLYINLNICNIKDCVDNFCRIYK